MFEPLRPVAQDDIFSARHVVDGALCPDGTCAVFVVSETFRAKDRVDDTQRTSLWRINLEDGEVRRLTPKGSNSTSPRFAPDAASMYFLSARDPEGKENQIFRLPMDGGEAEAVTHIAGGLSTFALSPDGTTLAFGSSGAITMARGARDHVRIDRLFYRLDGVPGYLQDFAQSLFVVSAQGGEPERVTEADGMIGAVCWSWDSKKIVFVRTAGTGCLEFGCSDLCVFQLGGKECRLVENELIQLPFWTADGTRVGYCSPPKRDLARQGQVYLIDCAGGVPTPRSAELDRAVPGLFQVNSPAGLSRFGGTARIAEGGDAVFLMVGDGGEGRIIRVALSGREAIETVIGGKRICKLVDLRGGRILFTAQDCNTPPELYIANLDGTNESRLTALNDSWRSRIRWPDVEHFKVKSEKNVEIEAWVLVPKNMPAPHRTVLYIHGGPHAAFGWSYNEDMHELAGAGYAVVFANPRGSLGYGDAFATSIVEHWGELEFVDFNAVLDELVARGIADPARLAVTGVSGGGHLTAWLITHTDRFRAAVPEQGVYNMFSMYGVADAGAVLVTREMGGLPHERSDVYWRLSPIAHAHKCHTPALIIQGEDDIRCPMQQAEELFTALQINGCKAELLRLRNCTHGLEIAGPPHLRRYRMDAMKDWFARYLT